MKKLVKESLNEESNFEKGQEVYFLYDYTLEKGAVEFVGIKKIKIAKKQWDGSLYYTRVPIEKVVLPNEMMCVVWEQWKGKNGSGGYRIEKELYKNRQKLAKEWPYQALVWEDSYGFESDHIDAKLDNGVWLNKRIN